MSSDSPSEAPASAGRAGSLTALLDPIAGLVAWALHFLFIYCANALACARGIGSANTLTQGAFRMMLVLATLAALAAVGAHAVSRWRQRGGSDDVHGFLAELAVGGDAVAMVGIGLQILPLLMLHLCR